jgi:NitT/TauT family transport system substrate-binding protein
MKRAAVLGSMLAAAVPSRAFSQTQSQPLIRIGGSPTDLYAEPFIALEAGFFAKAGLNVEVSSLANGGAIAAAVAGGALEIGLADMIQIANAVQRGLPFAFFAGGGLYQTEAPILAMCVAKTAAFASPKDLEGQTIALVALKSITEAAVKEWLVRGGADPSKVRFFELPYAEMNPALQRGAIGAAFIGEPFLSASKADIRVLGKSYDAVGPSFYISAFFGVRDWLAKNAETARKLTTALYEAARWANTHHEDSAKILVNYAKLDLERVRAMNRTTYATSLDIRAMQPVLDIAVRYSLIAKPTPASDLVVRIPT